MAEVTLGEYALVAVISFLASVFGGVAGYGSGLILPPILLPIIGPQAVVPVIALAALPTNGSRLAAFREDFDCRRMAVVVASALPSCFVGAYAYTLLSGPEVTLLIGAMLIALVPARRILARRRGHLQTRGLTVAGSGYGLLVGATAGSGVVLISILLAAGLSGRAVIATDAGISILLGIVKVGVFQAAGALPLSSWIMAAVIGVTATPGAFLAKRLALRMTGSTHIAILDTMVVLGGTLLVIQALRRLL